jgi:hypothetical protein
VCLSFPAWPQQPSAAAAPPPTGEVPLTKSLWEWKREIERQASAEIVLARAYTDKATNTMTLPEDIAHRDILKRYFLEETFVAQFYRSHATTVAYSGNDGSFSFVVLNMALASEWEGLEAGLVGHELGHIDLLARGYPAWAITDGESMCVGTVAGDVVQHVLIREELKRRNIPYFAYWMRNLNGALDRMEQEAKAARPPVKGDSCQAAARIGLWSDVRLGLTAAEWPRLARFELLMAAASPDLKPLVDSIDKRLRQAALWDRERYGSALVDVYQLVDRVRAMSARPVLP